MEQRVGSLTDQLNKQLEHHRELEQRARRLQTDASHLESQLHTADGNLAANDVLREGFLSDKDKVSIMLSFFFFNMVAGYSPIIWK